MADSAFWRNLAGQFIALQDRLRAGGPTAYVYKEFNVLAGQGARELPSASAAEATPDLFAVWFAALKEEDLVCPSSIQPNEVVSDDDHAQKLEVSYLDRCCEDSAIFCKQLEDKALQAEFKARRQSRSQPRVPAEKSDGRRRSGVGRPSLKFRSEIKRAILIQLTKNPSATDAEVCRGLDADGAVELPATWRSKPADRHFFDAYSKPHTRHKIENVISRVRGYLRQRGLLD
jgi:hypothetical protein